MRTWIGVVLVFVGWLAATTPARAWGFDVHRFITGRAIDELPDEIRPFFQDNRVFMIEHAIDPDLWRSAGFEAEPPRHFLDLDAYGRYPFAELPEDFDAAVRAFGRDRVTSNGTLPWRAAEIYERLVDAFTRAGASRAQFARTDVMFFATVLGHYVSDALVPFHAVVNYDGQLTNQRGIHARFESALFARYGDRLRLSPPRLEPMKAPVAFVFGTLREGTRLVPGLLEVDRAALGDGRNYDARYFDRFFLSARPILERRLSEAIAAVRAAVTGAWETAGSPSLRR